MSPVGFALQRPDEELSVRVSGRFLPVISLMKDFSRDPLLILLIIAYRLNSI
jgi:hypothetical protein